MNIPEDHPLKDLADNIFDAPVYVDVSEMMRPKPNMDNQTTDQSEARRRPAGAGSTAPERLAQIVPGVIIEQQAMALRHYSNAVQALLIQRPAMDERLSDDALTALGNARAAATCASDLREAWERAGCRTETRFSRSGPHV